jgi:hypothetical protein
MQVLVSVFYFFTFVDRAKGKLSFTSGIRVFLAGVGNGFAPVFPTIGE